jgi:uncharacterized protein (UPF0276 family)
MRIGATLSPALMSLLTRDLIDVDYIEVNGEMEIAELQTALAQRPVLLHDISYRFWLNYEDPFDAATVDKARAMIGLAQPPWHSTGIGASAELPLARVREIHINHPYNDGGRQMLDRHLPIGEADIALLEWTLARTPLVEAVTLESHLPDEAALRRDVDLLRNIVTG